MNNELIRKADAVMTGACVVFVRTADTSMNNIIFKSCLIFARDAAESCICRTCEQSVL